MGILRAAGFMTCGLVLAACSGSGLPAPPSSPLAASAAAATPTPVQSLQTWCEDGIATDDCGALRDAALGVVDGSGRAPTHVWVNSGVLCPIVEDCLFNPSANFPAPTLSGPGQSAGELVVASGSAEIAFAGTDEHAGINFFDLGSAVTPVLIGYRVPDRAWCSGFCPSAAATEGAFRLELVGPHLDWRVGEPVVGTQAILEYSGSAPTTVYGAADVIAFGYADAGSKRRFGPAFDLSCQPTPLDPTTGLTVPLGKSGGNDPGNPNDAWIPAFLAADGVQLPAGTWNVTAYAVFGTDPGCQGHHTLQATLQLTVGG